MVHCLLSLLLVGGLSTVAIADPVISDVEHSLGYNADCPPTIGPVTDLVIENADIAPDGFTRAAVLAGGTYPGPLITGSKNDNFKINVIDKLEDSSMLRATSIHWHGLFQKGTNWADGGASVNQCPIVPGNSFEYQFQALNQAGTYWYHSHFGTQYCDGLRGPIVVYDPDDKYNDMYDCDDASTVITLSDWYHTPAPVLNQIAGPAIPDSVLINGLGRWQAGNMNTELSVINVVQSKRYRLRVIGMSCSPNFIFSIDHHKFTVIEADGEYTEPLRDISSVQVFAGQRYSLILCADQPVDNYVIRANPNEGPPGFEGGINSAILRYIGAPETEPDFTPPADYPPPLMLETDLHARDDCEAPGRPEPEGADVNINMLLDLNFGTGLFTINNVAFIPPDVPVLLQILNADRSKSAEALALAPEGSVYPLPLNKSIQLAFPVGPNGKIGGPHPFHLHGHSFSVVRSAGSENYNYENPVKRDVVSATTTGNATDNVTIRFRTDNSGPWFLHCHIDWHLDKGFAAVFAEDAPDTAKTVHPTQQWEDLCPAYDRLSKEEIGGILPNGNQSI
ncbi:laccase lcc6 [Rhodocollybia butyracea]|uniref:Laccase lcc6 n=1 Tax=Rhodocollybia butyracea TaxID=206335 RepID=A0A9P5Q1K4_9AGAR|nr:laccase lcc6 [Rhodocollybia butyracea]